MRIPWKIHMCQQDMYCNIYYYNKQWLKLCKYCNRNHFDMQRKGLDKLDILYLIYKYLQGRLNRMYYLMLNTYLSGMMYNLQIFYHRFYKDWCMLDISLQRYYKTMMTHKLIYSSHSNKYKMVNYMRYIEMQSHPYIIYSLYSNLNRQVEIVVRHTVLKGKCCQHYYINMIHLRHQITQLHIDYKYQLNYYKLCILFCNQYKSLGQRDHYNWWYQRDKQSCKSFKLDNIQISIIDRWKV